jgi:hypothetical protein
MSFSLEAALRTCKVDTAWANRVQTDRMFNPNNMVCPVWNGMDNAGREVSPDSYYTKSAGCNSAEDRVLVENDQRPQYMEYVNLSAQGFQSDIYENTMPWENISNTTANSNAVKTCPGYGNFGIQMSAQETAPCSYNQYSQAMAQQARDNRLVSNAQNQYLGSNFKTCSGF